MKFAHKIGLAFFLLTALTLATGCIGLLFVNRVLSTLGSVSDEQGPLVRNLDDLNRFMRKAVALSGEVSTAAGVEDLAELRQEFLRLAHEFDRAFSAIRDQVQDEISLGGIEAMRLEQRRLTEQTQSLIAVITDELQVERQLEQRLSESHLAWRQVVQLLGLETAGEAATRASGLADSRRYGPELPSESPAAAPDDQRLRVLPQVQHSLMLARLETSEYFALKDPQELEQADARVRGLFARAAAAVGTLYAFPLEPALGERTARIESAFAAWRDALTAPEGALELHRRRVELVRRTDLVAASIRSEALDTLRILDSLVSIRNRLLAPDAARGFVTAAPSLLILTVVAATVVSALLGVVLTMSITKPVRSAIAAAEAVGRGDFSHRLEIASRDELSQLGGAFNRMTAEIARSQEHIRSLNAGLEQRVEERTRELEAEIAERRRAELSLRESEDRYRTLIESFPSGIIALVDRSLDLIAVGGEALRRAGANPLDFAGRPVSELCPPELAADLIPRLRAAFGGAAQDLECSAMGKQWHVSLVRNPSGPGARTETITVLARDVTEAKRNAEEMKRKQEQLVQADKLASLGVLVAGVAHEINNPNQAIMMGGQLVSRVWPDVQRVMDRHFEREGDFLVGGASYSALRETLGEQLRGIVGSARRIEAIVSSLKDLARNDHTGMAQPVNLNVAVKSALVLLGAVLRKATDHLDVALASELPALWGNAQQVEQVVVNLVHNACQALRERRQPISITTRATRAARAARADGEGEGVVLEIRDGGIGIPEDQLARIMDPFFTTKRDSGGTGLGLSVSASIVKEHGGRMEFASKPGEGTTVTVWFPARGTALRRVR